MRCEAATREGRAASAGDRGGTGTPRSRGRPDPRAGIATRRDHGPAPAAGPSSSPVPGGSYGAQIRAPIRAPVSPARPAAAQCGLPGRGRESFPAQSALRGGRGGGAGRSAPRAACCCPRGARCSAQGGSRSSSPRRIRRAAPTAPGKQIMAPRRSARRLPTAPHSCLRAQGRGDGALVSADGRVGGPLPLRLSAPPAPAAARCS